ncbi:Pentatricopeptide repeat superfamily protein [Artemisia annua]|uniref:Pentatricopeptide repeat superfamily protein n=1 Tax=Artemisia annua TaxID=35608 RepID=A0A2U1QBC3_ARTAN|nr:Pentatricopeptide repeat superfamily protein [Artemisia annua]
MGSCHKVFGEMSQQVVVSWTWLITGLIGNMGCLRKLVVFERIVKEGVVSNRVTMVNVVAACTGVGTLTQVFGVQEARDVFLNMEEKNVFAWVLKDLVNTKLVKMW